MLFIGYFAAFVNSEVQEVNKKSLGSSFLTWIDCEAVCDLQPFSTSAAHPFRALSQFWIAAVMQIALAAEWSN